MNRRGRAGRADYVFLILLPFLVSIFFLPDFSLAWPTESQWLPINKGGVYLQDAANDTVGARNIVGDATTYPSAYVYFDGAYVHHRLRLDGDPAGTLGQGFLKSFGWGVEIDTNQTDADYEWLFMIDGIGFEEVSLRRNTVQETPWDPSDDTEMAVYSVPIAPNYRVTPADSSFNGDPDYFLEWRLPQEIYMSLLGLDRYTPIRLFFGSSTSTQCLTKNGADLVGANDLSTGWSDYITTGGTVPSDGAVRFAADPAGNGDVTLIGTGDTIWVRVEDQDENLDRTNAQSLTAVVTTERGDLEIAVLTETGADTGVFTGPVLTAYDAAYATGDGILQVMTGETVTVTYLDNVTAAFARNVSRVDTLTVAQPAVSVSKSVLPGGTPGGGTVTYTVTVINGGMGVGVLTSLTDSLPEGFSYVPGSTGGFTADDPSIAGRTLAWNGLWQVPRRTGGVDGTLPLTFRAVASTVQGTYANLASVEGNNFAPASTGPTAPVAVGNPEVVIVKSVDRTSAAPGTELTYGVSYRNTGVSAAYTLIIVDAFPAEVSYVPGSLRVGGAGATYDTAAPRTDAADGDGGDVSPGSVVFTLTVVSPDDGLPGSGPDEGVVFFKVVIR